MDNDIKVMFEKKNRELLFQKLILDLENNTDTFKKTIKYKIGMEFALLVSSLKKIYAKNGVFINDKNLNEILNESHHELIKKIRSLAETKQKNNRNYIEEPVDDSLVKHEYIEEYHSHIDKTEETFESDLELNIRQTIGVELHNAIVNFSKIKTEEMKNQIYKKLTDEMPTSLIKKIKDDSNIRNLTLKNMSEETFKEYEEKNNLSLNFSKNNEEKQGQKKAKKTINKTPKKCKKK